MTWTRPFSIAPFPATSGNPYLRLFHSALEAHGVTAREDAVFSPRWVWREAGTLDALHFHWPDLLLYGRPEPALRGAVKLLALLVIARLRGLRVLWTVHNLEPHRSPTRLSAAVRRWLARSADLVICHSKGTAADVIDRYPRRVEVVVMPHGNYEGVYPHAETQPAEARRAFDLDPERPIVACLGLLRDYKGLDTACDAVLGLGTEATLVIAGAPHSEFDVAALAERVQRVPGAVLVPRNLTDEEFALVVRAADLVLLPYRKITGSGTLLSAWTLGRAVVASGLPFFREVIRGDDAAGWLYPPGDVEAFIEVIRTALAVPAAQREAAARARAERYDWNFVILPVAEVIGRWRGHTSTDAGGKAASKSKPDT